MIKLIKLIVFYDVIVISDEKNLPHIIDQIGVNWIKLGSYLGMETNRLQIIRAQNDQIFNQCLHMFNYIINLRQRDFTKLKLVKALVATGLLSVAVKNELCQVCSDDAAGKKNSFFIC